MALLYRVPCNSVGAWSNVSNGTVYCPIGNSVYNSGQLSSTFSIAKITQRTAGYYNYLHIRVITNSSSADTVFAVYKNGVQTSLSVTVPAGATGAFINNTEWVSVADGDDIAYGAVKGDTGVFNTIFRCVDFLAAQATYKVLSGGSGNLSAGTDKLFKVGGIMNSKAIQGYPLDYISMCVAPCDMVAKNLYTNVSSGSYTVTSSVSVGKNAAAGALSVSFPTGSVVGVREDTTNTVSYSQGDTIHMFQTISGGSGSMVFRIISFDLVGTSPNIAPEVTANLGSQVANASNVFLAGICSQFLSNGSAAATRVVTMNAETVVSNLFGCTSANTSTTSDYLHRLRKAGTTDTALALTVPTGTTGIFSETATSVTYAVGEQMDWRSSFVSAPNGAIVIPSLSFQMTITGEPDPFEIPANDVNFYSIFKRRRRP